MCSSTGFQVYSEARDAAFAHKPPLFSFVLNTEKAYNLCQDRISNVETLLKIRVEGRDARLCPRSLEFHLQT